MPLNLSYLVTCPLFYWFDPIWSYPHDSTCVQIDLKLIWNAWQNAYTSCPTQSSTRSFCQMSLAKARAKVGCPLASSAHLRPHRKSMHLFLRWLPSSILFTEQAPCKVPWLPNRCNQSHLHLYERSHLCNSSGPKCKTQKTCKSTKQLEEQNN